MCYCSYTSISTSTSTSTNNNDNNRKDFSLNGITCYFNVQLTALGNYTRGLRYQRHST